MIHKTVQAGATNVEVVIRIIDSADGTPETAVEHNTAGIDLEYRREGAVSTDITEAALAALTTAHTDGGIEHIGNGYYRLDVPDAAFAAGSDSVLIHGTVTGMVVIGCYVELVTHDPQVAISDLDSALVVVSTKIDSDMVVLDASHTKTQSDIALTTTPLSDIESSLVIVKSDLVVVEVSVSDIESALVVAATKQDSDMVVLDTSHTKTQSDIALTTTPLSDIESSLVIVKSDLVVVTTDVASLSTKQDSDMVVLDASHTKTQSDVALTTTPLSDIESSLVIVKSDLVAIETETVTAAGEPGQGAPGVSVSRGTKIDYLYKAWRNRKTQDATTWELYADDATTIDQKATLSDDGTDFEKGEIATGP